MAFEVTYFIWKASCLDTVLACLEGVIDELKFSVKVVPLTLKVVLLVIKSTIAFDLHNRVSTLLVCHCFVECMVGRSQAHEEIVEPGGYWVSGI